MTTFKRSDQTILVYKISPFPKILYPAKKSAKVGNTTLSQDSTPVSFLKRLRFCGPTLKLGRVGGYVNFIRSYIT